jgi:PPOX class probable FMN-dependent enzyme
VSGDLDDEARLRARYREPHEIVLRKQRAELDGKAREFVARSPFVVLATTSDRGTDASPRGGAPGFVSVLDPKHLAFGDLSGNNRLDSYANIVRNPHVGLLFFVPGVDETLRVNGRARITTDPAVLARTTVGTTKPKVAIVVELDECYVHCGKAVRRAALWDTETWPDAADRPSPEAILVEHLALDVDASVVRNDLEAGYRDTLWSEGGT